MSELARKTYEAYHKQRRKEIEAAMPYGTMLEKARKSREEAQKLEENKTTVGQVLSKDKTWSDWRKDRDRITELKNEAEAAEQAASAYSAMMREKGANRLSIGQLENYLNAPNANKNPDIGYYRKAYDKKMSVQATKNLPKNVLNLLDQYNSADANATADAYSSFVAAMTGQKSGILNKAGARKAQIGQELERLGYSNYKDLAAYRKYVTDSKANEKTQKEFENYAKNHPVAAAASARLLSPTATVSGFGGWIKNSVSNSPLQSPNTKGTDFQLSRAKNTIDDTVSNSFEDGKLSKKTKAFLYQTGMSGIDSLTASLLGRGGGPLLGGGALVDSYIDASEKGASQRQALLSSAAAGIAESLFETVSIGQLQAMKEIAPTSLKAIVTNIARSTLTNFTEEATTEIANIFSDYLINGGISDFQQQYAGYKRTGLSGKEAAKKTFGAMGKRVLEAGAGGALMGAAFGGIGSFGGKINYESQLRERGRNLAEYGGEEKLLASAYQFGTDGDEKLAKAANSVEQNRNELFRKTEEFESAETAVDNRLTELGENQKNIKKVSPAAIKAIMGERLSAKDKRAIKNSEYGQRVIGEISNARSEEGGNASSEWAKEVIDNIDSTQDAKKEKPITRPEYTSKELRQIGKLEEALSEHTGEKIKGSIKKSVEERLKGLGESKENIKKITEAAVKAVSGEELSARDEKAIKKSKYGQRVFNEISDAMNENGDYSSNWAIDMKDDLDGIYDVFSSPDVDAYRNRAYESSEEESGGTQTAPETRQTAQPEQRYITRTDMSKGTLKVMDELREDGQDREAYERSFEAFYSMGKSGYTKEAALANKTAAVTDDFSDFQKEKAFELGQAAKEVQNQVKLSQIAEIGANDTIVLDTDGNKVSLSEVNADRGVKLLFNKATKLGDVEAANAFLGGYEGGVDVNLYEDSFRSFNAAGRQNQNISFEQFMNEHEDMKELYDYIKPETAEAAYITGAEYATNSTSQQPKTLKRSSKAEGRFTNNTTAAETDAVFEAVAKKLGVEIIKEQSLWSEDGREANAQFIPSQMKILLSSEAQSEFTDTVHELGHLAESYNGEKMASVRGALLDWYAEKNGNTSLEDTISRFQESYGTSRENAIEEMTSEALAGLFSTDEGVNDFMSWLKEDSGYSKAEKKTVLRRIVDFFDCIIEAIKETIQNGELSKTAREFAQMQADKAAEIREMFLEALDGIDSQKKEKIEGKTRKVTPKNKQNVKYSIKKLSDGTKYVKLDGNIFVDVNGNELSSREVYNNLVGLPVVTDDGEKITLVKRLSKGKDMYNEFFKRWATFEKGIDIKKLNTEINKNIIDVLTSSTVENQNIPDVNSRHSKYGISAFDTRNVIIADDSGAYNLKLSIAVLTNGSKIGYAKKRISKNGEIWQKIKKATSMSESQFSKPSDNSISHNSEKSQEKSFADKDTNVTDSEIKNSLKLTDSDGNELSEEQRKFFENVDSSLKDEEGRLKPFYHGTARADRVGYYFDPERATSGPMAFFTDNEMIAGNYARDKADTSLAYDSDYDSYETQFRVKVGNESIPVASLWNRLTLPQKKAITQKAQQLTIDDDYENFVLQPGNEYGNGGFDLRYARGNAIQALIDSWLAGGYFIGEEERFLDVLKAVGINNVEYKDPNYREEKVYKAYLNITNPFNTENVDSQFIDDLTDFVENTDMSIYEKESANADMWDKNDIDISDWIERLQDDYENGTTYSWTSIPDVVTDFLKEYGGYDGIIDKGGKQGGEIHTVAIPFYSNQIKEVTNKAPTAENSDIRYSLRQSLGITNEGDSNSSLLSQNEEYRKLISELQTQLGKRHFVDAKKVQTLARVIKEDYRSTIRTDELSAMLGDFYDSVANNKGLSWDVVRIKTREIAEAVVSKSKNMTEISERSKSIIDDIRSVAVKLSDEQKAEVASSYGSYNNFRRSSFGTLKIRNDGIELDQRFSELAEAYPDIFNKETADVDQPILLFEAVKALKNGYYDGESGFDHDSAVDFLAADIYEKYFEIPDSKSLEDDYKLKLNREKVKMRESLEKAKAKFKEEYENNLRLVKIDYYTKSFQFDKELLQNKARYEQRVQKIADTNTRAQERKAIIRKVKRLSNMLLKTSTKSGYVGEKDGKKLIIYNNIPEELRKPVAALCELFADDNSVFDYEKLDGLRSSYAAIRANTPAEETYLSGIYDADVEAELERLKKTISGKRLSALSQNQLGTIRNVLDHFDAMIKNETEIFMNGRTQQVKDVGTRTLNELKAKGKKKHRQLGALQSTADMTNKLTVNNLKPVYFFEKVGGEFKTLYWDLHKGQDKYVQNVESAESFFRKTVEQFGADKWLKKNDKVTFTTVRREKLGLTLEQRLLIYATAKREQLSGQNSLHLMSGGVVFENQITKSKDKTRPWKFRDEDAQAHPLAIEDITKIVQSLTDNQKKFADSLVGYLSGDMAQLGNEVSMQLYGYRKFTEKYYIPFNSAQSFGFQRFGEQGESLLRSLSFTKQTVRGAATPLVLSDFTEVFAKHVERMSAYNALVVPLENIGKVWNFKTVTSDSEIGASVASQFETAFGKEYKDYLIQFVKDVNGNVMSDNREGVYNSLLRKFKKSAVFASASVAIQQPSAVCRAFAEVNPKYFLASTFDSRKSYDECMKYAPIALLKEIGGFDTSSGRNMVDWILESKNKPEGKERIKAFFTDSDYRDNILSAAPGLTDRITWAHIWNAVKRETKAKTGLSGEKLLQKAGERFTEVIEKTQVYDSVLTRSGNMRSKSATMQTVTAFMAEPTTTINMLYDAASTLKQNPKKFARVLSSVVTATLFNAALKSIITATRDDDEEKTNLEKYLAQVVGNFLGDMNPMTLVPFLRDIYSLMTGYDVSRSDMDMFSNLIDAIQKCTSGDNITFDKKITSLAGALGDFFGIPAKNIIRDVYSLKTAVRDIRAPEKTTEKGIKFAIQAEIFPSLKNLNLLDEASRQEKLYEAWLDKDAETYKRIAKGYKSGTAIKNALTNEIKKDYLDGTITAEKAEELLSPLVDEKNKGYYKIREWDDGEEADEEEDEKNEGFYSLDTAKVKKKAKEKKKKVSNVLLTLQGKDTEIEDNEETDEPYAKFTYLEEAIKQSDASAFKKEAADLRKHGISRETIEKKAKSYLKSDKKVIAAGKRYAKGDVDALDESEIIAQKYGIEKETVAAAIRAAAGVTTYSDSLTAGTDYIYSDMHMAIAAHDNEESARIAKDIIEAKVAKKISEGVSRSEAEKNVYYGVRSSIASKWKPIYLSASSTERARIRESLYATGAYSSLYALDKTLANWRDGKD